MTVGVDIVEQDNDFAIETTLSAVPDRELRRYEKLLAIRNTRLEFAQKYHVNQRGEKMQWGHKHILDLYEETSPKITLQGSTQCMKSEWVICTNLAAMYCGLNVFFVLPKHNMRSTYVRNRIDRLIEASPGYKAISGHSSGSHLKQFGRGVTRYVSSNRQADFTEFPADLVIVEELDHCDQNNLLFADDRLQASPYQFYYRIGNPIMEKKGINKFFLAGDRKRWCVRCNYCGKYRVLDWFKQVVRTVVNSKGKIIDYKLRDREWSAGCGRDIRAICPCGGVLERTNGIWYATKPENYYSGGSSMIISALMNRDKLLQDMWFEFVPAMNDVSKMAHFYRSLLGLPYTPSDNKIGNSALSAAAVEGLFFTEDGEISYIPEDEHEGPCFLGMDVGATLDVSVIYQNNRGTKVLVYCGKLRTLDEVRSVIARYGVRVAVADVMPETSLVRELQQSVDIPVWLCRYSESTSGVSGGIRLNAAQLEALVDRTEHLDATFKALVSKTFRIPENYLNIMDGVWFKEMVSSVKSPVETSGGKMVYRWLNNDADHQFHALSYAMLAAHLGGERMSVYVG